jgi:hypothetical protein
MNWKARLAYQYTQHSILTYTQHSIPHTAYIFRIPGHYTILVTIPYLVVDVENEWNVSSMRGQLCGRLLHLRHVLELIEPRSCVGIDSCGAAVGTEVFLVAI